MATKYKYRYTEVYNGIRIDLRANTQKELISKVNKKKTEIDNQASRLDPFLHDFVYDWLENYKRDKVTVKWYKYMQGICQQIVEHFGKVKVSKINAVMWQEFMNTQSKYTKTRVKKAEIVVKQLISTAYHNNIIPKTLVVEAPAGRENRSGRRITDEERRVLLEVLNEGHRGNLYCKIMLYCGLRPQEVEALTWSDIDFDSGTISVNKAIKDMARLGATKTKAGKRYVPIPKLFLTELEQYRCENKAYICTSTTGKRHTISTRQNMWHNIKREMNIKMGAQIFRGQLLEPLPLNKDFKLYYLRHTYCTDLELKGVPINIAKTLMGHSDISITAKIYTHATDETVELARTLIDA